MKDEFVGSRKHIPYAKNTLVHGTANYYAIGQKLNFVHLEFGLQFFTTPVASSMKLLISSGINDEVVFPTKSGHRVKGYSDCSTPLRKRTPARSNGVDHYRTLRCTRRGPHGPAARMAKSTSWA